MVVTGPLLTFGAVLTGDARLVIWALAAALELSTPTVFRRQLRGIHYDAGHLSERFGAFVLIAIGESIVAVGAPAAGERHLTAAELASVAVAFVLCCGLWWVYFQFATDAMRHALATAQVQLNVTRHVLSYGHILFIASIMTIAVGMTDAVSRPTARLGWDVVALLFVGCAVYLAAFGYTRWMMFKKVSSTRLTAAALMLVALPLARALPAIAALGLAASVVAGLNVVEYLRVSRERRAAAADAQLSGANPR
jgi:low temperature requirement protein LtrA